jgi:uncharacterized membrane protein
MLIGLLFLNPLLGAGIGAGAGALSGKFADIGINDQFMKDLAATFTPGSSALFVLVRKSTPEQSAGRAQAVCRQGPGSANLAHQGQRGGIA